MTGGRSFPFRIDTVYRRIPIPDRRTVPLSSPIALASPQAVRNNRSNREERACCKMPRFVMAKPARGCGDPFSRRMETDSHDRIRGPVSE